TFVFDRQGYYKYTPPATETVAPNQGPQLTTTFTSAANADDNGIALNGYSRSASLNGAPTYSHNNLNYVAPYNIWIIPIHGGGVGISGGGNGTVDGLETLVISFNRNEHPHGVQG